MVFDLGLPKVEASLKKIDRTSLPGTLLSCFEWTSVINDKQLISNPGSSLIGRAKQLSGLTISFCRMPGNNRDRVIKNGTVTLCEDQSIVDEIA